MISQMKPKGLLTLLLMTLSACASSDPESALISDTVATLGGADAINAVSTLVLEGTGDAYNLGQDSDPNTVNPSFLHVANLIENIENYNVRVDPVLPIHGQSEPFTNVTRATQAEARATGAESE